MTLLRPAWETWNPHTAEDRDAVLFELQKILASQHFCNSKRYPALLQYIIEHALAGRVDQLKERTLGIEVFHRLPDYDTNADTVVRYTAGEVRKRLALYYHENDTNCRIQIVLPVGSYAPEFLRAAPEDLENNNHPVATETAFLERAASAHKFSAPSEIAGIAIDGSPGVRTKAPQLSPAVPAGPSRARRILQLVAIVLLVIGAFVGGLKWQSATEHQQTDLDRFWAPVFHQSGTALLCSGAVVFDPRMFSGVITANRDNEYPFVSFQVASTIARLSGLLERNRIEYQMQPCTSAAVTELRERPLILLGGYNNQWTLRLVGPLRYNLAPGTVQSIVDRDHPDVHWQRDPSRPYSSADDYGLIARFHDPTTDSMVVVVAGLGRNGTEAAGQFVTSPHYMQLLHARLGHDLATKSIEAIVKVSVIDGKSGAPSLEAACSW
jgi:hypothetical protein